VTACTDEAGSDTEPPETSSNPGAASDAAPTDLGPAPDTAADAARPTPFDAALAVTERNGRLYDASGREVLFRGVNARVAGLFDVGFSDGRLPLIPVEAFGPADCRFLSTQLGANLLRLPVNWSALEPIRGRIDEAYLDRVEAVVRACAEEGVHTLVDLHQDAYSKEIGQDGAPLWAIVPPPATLLGGPLTDLEARRLSPQVIAAFGSLYDNVDGLSDAHAAMAAHVARRIASLPGVLALELHNEPVSFQAPRLADFHERSGRAVRAAAPSLPIAFEPDALRNLRDAAAVTHPFPFDGTIYAPHLYTGVFSRGRDNWADGNVEALERSMAGTRREADAHGAALLVGEYGIDPRAPRALEWLGHVHRLFDVNLASAAFWVYEEYGEGQWGLYDAAGPREAPTRGPLREAIALAVAHPYPQAVAGRLVSTVFDPARNALEVTFADPGPGEHWLSAPALRYPAGVRVRCDDEVVPHRTGPGRVAVYCGGARLELLPAPP
jgi:hypothetical protein